MFGENLTAKDLQKIKHLVKQTERAVLIILTIWDLLGISLSWLSLSISSLRDLMLAIPTGISSKLLLNTSRDSNIERWQISSLKNQEKKQVFII